MSAAVLPLHEQALGGSDQGSEPAIEPGRRSGAQPGGAFLPHRHGHLRHFGGRGSGARGIGEDMTEYDVAFVDQPQRVLEHRSEEHTSELQSLMRISYAV